MVNLARSVNSCTRPRTRDPDKGQRTIAIPRRLAHGIDQRGSTGVVERRKCRSGPGRAEALAPSRGGILVPAQHADGPGASGASSSRPEIVPRLLEAVRTEHADLVVTSRCVAGGREDLGTVCLQSPEIDMACERGVSPPARSSRDRMSGSFLFRRDALIATIQPFDA